jgi:serine/threonine-protein kinase RsbW
MSTRSTVASAACGSPATGQPPRRARGVRYHELLRLTVPCEAEHLRSLRKTASDFAQHHRVERPQDVALAVSEACANVVVHAYRDHQPGPLHLTGFVDSELVYLVIIDEGTGLAPRLDSPGLGLGLPLIARLTNHFEITERRPTGTVVTMGFARARAPT